MKRASSFLSNFKSSLLNGRCLTACFGFVQLVVLSVPCCEAVPSKEDEQVVQRALDLKNPKAGLQALDRYLLSHPKADLVAARCAKFSNVLQVPSDSIKYASKYFALKPLPVDPDLYKIRANAYLATNQPEKALSDVNQARKLLPQDASVCILAGHSLKKLGRIKEALADYTRAAALKEPAALWAKAETEFEHQMFKEAIAHYLEYGQKTKNFNSANVRANELYHSGHYVESLSLTDGLLALNDTEVELHAVRAYVLYKIRRWQEALQECDVYTNKSGKSIGTLKCLILTSEAKWDAAAGCLNIVIRDNPTDSGARLLRANCLWHLHRYDEALADYNKFPDALVKNPQERMGKAECLSNVGNYQAALKEYVILNSVNPTADSYANQAACLSTLQRYREAAACFDNAINLRPTASRYLYGRGDCFRRLKNYPSAISDLSQAIQLHPQNLGYVYNRGLCYLEMKHNNLAINDFTKALADPRLQSRAYRDRAKAYENLGQQDLAKKDRVASASTSKSIEADLFK